MIRLVEKFPDQLSANQCKTFTTEKEVDPCQSNFWQVNVEGKEFIPNAENGWHFKDKDCTSYAYATLPLAVQTPTVAPSRRTEKPPTVSPSPIYVEPPSPIGPTKIPSPSKRPSPTEPTSTPSKKVPDTTPTLAPTLAPQTKSKGKAKKTTTDGEWEYNVRRRRRG